MDKYKLSVTKGQKKYSIIVSGASQEEVRERVHKEGYSILTVEKYDDADLKGIKFIFQVDDPLTKTLKQGTILGEDIFKVYLKLKDELGYEPVLIYKEDEINTSAEEKQKTINSLKEQYQIYKTTIQSASLEPVRKVQENLKESTIQVDGFYQKKELEETYKLIDFVLKKLESVIEKAAMYEIDTDQKDRLKEIYNSIVKIKKSTNVSKLKQIGETALVRIGAIELKYLEKNKNKASKELLKETNKLLKQTGSTRQFVEKSRDIGLFFSSFVGSLNSLFEKKPGTQTHAHTEIDKESYSYLKTILLLNKYRSKQSQNNKEIFKNILLFLIPFGKNREKTDMLLLKAKVISQNISLLKAKRSGKIFSYTYVTKGYSKIVAMLIESLYSTRNYIFGAVAGYAFVFLVYINASYYNIVHFDINFNGIFYYIMVLCALCFINISRGIMTLTLNIVFLVFLFIFGVVNF